MNGYRLLGCVLNAKANDLSPEVGVLGGFLFSSLDKIPGEERALNFWVPG